MARRKLEDDPEFQALLERAKALDERTPALPEVKPGRKLQAALAPATSGAEVAVEVFTENAAAGQLTRIGDIAPVTRTRPRVQDWTPPTPPEGAPTVYPEAAKQAKRQRQNQKSQKPKGGDSHWDHDPGYQEWVKNGRKGTGVGRHAGPFEPKPFEWWPTGLGDVFAGRQLLDPADADRLVTETGVTHVLDLREKHEWTRPNRGEGALERLRELGIVRKALHIKDVTAPTKAKFREAVEFLTEATRAGGLVYVHCRAGKERTATILLAFAVRGRNLPPEEAWLLLKEACKLFKPTYAQAKAAVEWLELPGVLPCYDCGMPLSVGPHVGRADCKACHDSRVKGWAKESKTSKASSAQPPLWQPGANYYGAGTSYAQPYQRETAAECGCGLVKTGPGGSCPACEDPFREEVSPLCEECGLYERGKGSRFCRTCRVDLLGLAEDYPEAEEVAPACFACGEHPIEDGSPYGLCVDCGANFSVLSQGEGGFYR
jgi:hypothetical protein